MFRPTGPERATSNRPSRPRVPQQTHSKLRGGHDWTVRGASHVCCASYGRGSTHYSVLGLDCTASPADIKKAYRQAALQYHPDVNKDESAVALFTRCNEAYEVLSDNSKRRAYDLELEARQRGMAGGVPFTSSASGFPSSVWDMVEEVFNSTGPTTTHKTGSPGRRQWDMEDDSDGDDDYSAEELFYELEYEHWAATGSNFRSSFTASFSGANGRKKRANAAARAQRAEQERAAAAAAAGIKGKARQQKGRPKGRGSLDGIDVEELLGSLGPEARITAQRTFGRQLERLNTREELIDFFEVLTTLRDDMGVAFEMFSSPEAQDTYHRTSVRSTIHPSSRASSNSGTSTSGRQSVTRASAGAARQTGTASSHGRGVGSARQSSGRRGSPVSEDDPLFMPSGKDRGRSGRAKVGGKQRASAAAKARGMPSWREDESDTEDDGWVDVWAVEETQASTGGRTRHGGRSAAVNPTSAGRPRQRHAHVDDVEVTDHSAGVRHSTGSRQTQRAAGRGAGVRQAGPFDDLFGGGAGHADDDEDDGAWEALFDVGQWDTRKQR